MKHLIFPMKFITPAFIAGADQNEPEIRSASIRGAIRWWFRIVGGTKIEEDEVFGFARKTNGASKVTIRVINPKIINNDRDLPCPQNTIPGYLIYFAHVSGNDQGIARTKARHYIGYDSTFTLEVLERYPIDIALWEKLTLAVKSFCVFGTLGLRETRGFGKVALQSPHSLSDVLMLAGELYDRGVYLFKSKVQYSSASEAQGYLGDILKNVLRKQWPAKRDSALGSSTPRSTSALQLCPVLTSDSGVVPFFLYTDNACGEASLMPTLSSLLIANGFVNLK